MAKGPRRLCNITFQSWVYGYPLSRSVSQLQDILIEYMLTRNRYRDRAELLKSIAWQLNKIEANISIHDALRIMGRNYNDCSLRRGLL